MATLLHFPQYSNEYYIEYSHSLRPNAPKSPSPRDWKQISYPLPTAPSGASEKNLYRLSHSCKNELLHTFLFINNVGFGPTHASQRPGTSWPVILKE